MILLGAIAVGVIAALMLFQYIRGIEDRAFENAKRVQVFVAKGEVKRGVQGSEAVAVGNIADAEINQLFRPGSAINTTDEIAPLVALFDISPGTVIVKGMFVDKNVTQISFRSRLKKADHVAITVTTDPQHGVAGLLVPSDEVNLLIFDQPAGFNESTEETTAGGEGEANNQQQTTQTSAGEQRGRSALSTRARVLYQKVQILAIGQSSKLEPGEQKDPAKATAADNVNLVTFNVPPDAALWIASAANSSGVVYMTLVPEDYKATQIQKIPDTINELPGEQQGVLTPYASQGS